MLSQVSPEKGTLLISEPFMSDPNFKRTVVLLVENQFDGVVGYVLNQKSDLLLKDLVPECWDANMHVYVGGPVSTDTLHFVHCIPHIIIGGSDLGNGLFWGGDFDNLKTQINNYQVKDSDIKFFIGYSGWSKSQLINELKSNSWIVSDKYNSEMIFEESEEKIWKESVLNMGTKYAHIINFPEDPTLN